MAGQDSLALAAQPPAGASAALCPPSVAVPPFAEIYKQYFDFVWSSARHLGVGGAAIDDVVQEVFIVIHAKLHTLQHPESLRSWIYGIARRTVSGHRRANKPEASTGAHYETRAQSPGPAQATPLE